MLDELALLKRLLFQSGATPAFMKGPAAHRFIDFLEALDRSLVRFMSRYGLIGLRLALGLVFLWFGILKLIDRSPVADLVAETVYWLPEAFFVRFLGAWEVAVGVGLATGLVMRLTLLLFFSQMVGTLLVLVVQPDVAFQGSDPFLLTTEGEFVIKNLVLISAGLVLGARVRLPSARPQGGAAPKPLPSEGSAWP